MYFSLLYIIVKVNKFYVNFLRWAWSAEKSNGRGGGSRERAERRGYVACDEICGVWTALPDGHKLKENGRCWGGSLRLSFLCI